MKPLVGLVHIVLILRSIVSSQVHPRLVDIVISTSAPQYYLLACLLCQTPIIGRRSRTRNESGEAIVDFHNKIPDLESIIIPGHTEVTMNPNCLVRVFKSYLTGDHDPFVDRAGYLTCYQLYFIFSDLQGVTHLQFQGQYLRFHRSNPTSSQLVPDATARRNDRPAGYHHQAYSPTACYGLDVLQPSL